MNDIVVFGATGFVGRLVAEYLARQRARRADDRARGALARQARARPRRSWGRDWPLIVADLADPASLAAMARQARVVATTVGPYRRGGLKLVDACIAEGAHYCDLTGEILFAHESLSRHRPRRTPACGSSTAVGFDSIPSDLGTFLLHERAGELGPTTLVVTAFKGGASGGTLASMKGQVDEATADKRVRKIVFDPYSLGGDGPPDRDLRKVVRDKRLGWIGPFVMATYNTRIVRRSHSLLGYGPGFRYREVSRYPNPAAALGTTAVLGALAGGLAFKPTRMLLDRLLPDPGQGPSEK